MKKTKMEISQEEITVLRMKASVSGHSKRDICLRISLFFMPQTGKKGTGVVFGE